MKRRKGGIPQSVKDDVHRRSRGRCEAHIVGVCTGVGEHLHHVLLRSRGGLDEVGNLLDVCGRCHDHIHLNPTWATANGLMKSNIVRLVEPPYDWQGEGA